MDIQIHPSRAVDKFRIGTIAADIAKRSLLLISTVCRLKVLAEVIKAKIEAEHQASLFSPETVAKQIIEAKAKIASASSKAIHVDLTQLQEQLA